MDSAEEWESGCACVVRIVLIRRAVAQALRFDDEELAGYEERQMVTCALLCLAGQRLMPPGDNEGKVFTSVCNVLRILIVRETRPAYFAAAR